MEHRGRTSVPTDGWESADRCEQDSWGSDGYQHDELDALGLVDDDFLNLVIFACRKVFVCVLVRGFVWLCGDDSPLRGPDKAL